MGVSEKVSAFIDLKKIVKLCYALSKIALLSMPRKDCKNVGYKPF